MTNTVEPTARRKSIWRALERVRVAISVLSDVKTIIPESDVITAVDLAQNDLDDLDFKLRLKEKL